MSESEAASLFDSFCDQAAGRPMAVACRDDAAGLAAAEMARRWFAERGQGPITILTPGKAELLTGARLAERVRGTGARALLALDLGAGDECVAADCPTLQIDVHRHAPDLKAPIIEPPSPDAARPAGVVLYDLLQRLGPVTGLEWLAAIAAEAGHPKAALPAPQEAGKSYARTALREVQVLLNSGCRDREQAVGPALVLLARSDGPEDFLAGESSELERLRMARTAVMQAVAQWSHHRPYFMWRVALVPMASASRIEDILAAMWARQLANYMIVAANSGYVVGKVHVVARSDSPKRDLLRLLDKTAPTELERPFAVGRPDYVEAVLPTDAWERMLAGMRFRAPNKLIPHLPQPSLF
ncbi:MAG: hypothetical protein JXL80_16985 [Planctomycetes bacterium]|nr:hypothetical protein [Planctomycetota bacterium]